MKQTWWPMKQSSSTVTPSHRKLWLEILQRAPTTTFFWISTNAPMRVSSPIRQPYRFTKQWTATFRPSCTSGAMRTKLAGSARSCVGSAMGRTPVTEDHPAALGPDAPGGGLQQADDAQPQLPVADRRAPLQGALGEVAGHRLQRLARLDVRAPDVAAAVVDQQLAPLLLAGAELDPLVVDLDRLGRVQLVEDQ